MITRITETMFVDAMRDEFSWAASRALFEWIENLEDGMGEQIEFDRIGLRCDWREFMSDDGKEAIDLALEDYFRIGLEDCTADQLCDHTTVIFFDGGVLVQAF